MFIHKTIIPRVKWFKHKISKDIGEQNMFKDTTGMQSAEWKYVVSWTNELQRKKREKDWGKKPFLLES